MKRAHRWRGNDRGEERNLSNKRVRLILMAFDDEAVGPHRVPKGALLAVDDVGAEHKLFAGDVICFDKGGLHAAKAMGKMKTVLMGMA